MSTDLYGATFSTCTQRALCALIDVKKEYNFHPVNFMGGEHKSEEYIKKHQPFGKIPSLWEGDFHIFESRAIAQYICNAYDNRPDSENLYPKNPKLRAEVDNWIQVELNYYNPASEVLVSELFFKPVFFKSPTDQARVVELIPKLHVALAVMNERLAHHKYLGGDHFTLADLFNAPYTRLLLNIEQFKDVLSKYPNVDTWWKRVSEHPSWIKTIALSS